MLTESWKPIKDYEGIYEVSDLGRIKSLPRTIKSRYGYRTTQERIRKQVKHKYGYLQITLNKNRTVKLCLVHRLVAQAFIHNPFNKPEVNHKKGIKTDNRATELEWNTTSENMKHAYATGLTNGNGCKRKVAQVKNGKHIKTWESAALAMRILGINKCCISRCCRNINKIAGGFQWKFI